MKKHTAILGALVSLLPMGQPLVIGTSSAALTSAAVMLSVPQRARAESAEFYYKRGNKKYEVRDYSGAISDYNKAIKINPKDPLGYVLRGRLKWYLKDYKGALKDLDKAIKLDPK